MTAPVVAGCPHGQILRVSLNKCVGVHSKLAAGFVRALPRKRIVVMLPPARPAIEPPEIELLRERLASRATAELTAANILLSLAARLTAEVP